jgi:hypothetical protein
LSLHFSSSGEVSSREVLAIAGALRENKGLTELNLVFYGFVANDGTWGAICDSLKSHPTLDVLDLRATFRAAATTAPAVPTPRLQALLDMLKVNTSIHTLQLDSRYKEHDIFRASIIPYLETNRFRPRLLAI